MIIIYETPEWIYEGFIWKLRKYPHGISYCESDDEN